MKFMIICIFAACIAAASSDVICPDQKHACPDGNTCCKTGPSSYGCCPLPNAACCPDMKHCCPHGTTCDLGTGRCIQQFHSAESASFLMAEKVAPAKRVSVGEF